jgi:hypothetical protein
MGVSMAVKMEPGIDISFLFMKGMSPEGRINSNAKTLHHKWYDFVIIWSTKNGTVDTK